MNGDCCLVPTIPCRTMKSRVSRRQTSWSATGYAPSAQFLTLIHFRVAWTSSDLAVPTQGSKTSTRIILVACIFTASVLCIWNTGLKPFPDFPNATEMASPAASVSSKQGLEGMRAPDVQTRQTPG